MMKRMLVITTATAALMFAAAPSYAQDTNNMGGMYVTGEGENMMVMGGGNAEGARVLRGENFARPDNCPEGSFYMSGENTITACGDDGASFDVAAPGEGEMMDGGTAFPSGAMLLRPRESTESKQVDTGPEGDDADQGGDNNNEGGGGGQGGNTETQTGGGQGGGG